METSTLIDIFTLASPRWWTTNHSLDGVWSDHFLGAGEFISGTAEARVVKYQVLDYG